MKNKKPNLVIWGLKYSLGAAITGILCCVAPAVLFMLGLMSGIYAISFADFFYTKDGNIGQGALILRILAVFIALFGIYGFKKKQNNCEIDYKKKQLNLILLTVIIFLIGTGLFLSLEEWSSWYFDKYIVPAQQIELNAK